MPRGRTLATMQALELGGCGHVELFAGGGGLALGLKSAGFDHSVLIERDHHSCATLRANAGLGAPLGETTVVEADVRTVAWADSPVELLSGGAPCQPFSLGGKHRAQGDDRNLFPEVMRAVRTLKPRAVLMENVKGLTRASFRPYFDYLIRQLRHPGVAPRADEDWAEHDARLSAIEARGDEPYYDVQYQVLNAADYGVAQSRDRVFIVAVPHGSGFGFPTPTHRRPMHSQKAGEAGADGRCDWLTVRDALRGLPEPSADVRRDALDHWLIPGARTYTGHSGSQLDRPSKTIKAGVHGVPGGENMFVLDDGGIRYYTLREAARIQSFPDDYRFPVSRSEAMRQIGNAVPCRLAKAVGRSVWQALHE